MSDHLKQPIIFLGFPRSGTTIISEIIMQHQKLAWISNYQQHFPRSVSVNWLRNLFQNQFWNIKGQKDQLNEVSFFNKYIFRQSESYRFWNSVTQRDFAKSFLYKIEEGTDRRTVIRSFFRKLVYYQNRERLAFKVTGPSRLIYLHSIFPDACFIRIKREPLPTLRSLLKVGFWNDKGGGKGLWWNQEGIYNEVEQKHIQKLKSSEPALLAALQFKKVDEIYSLEKEQSGAKILEIAYENFIKQPADTLSRILAFIEMEEDSNVSAYLAENKIYNRNRKQEYFIAPGLDSKVLRMASEGVKSLN